MTKVVVSPAQKSIPSITANGRRITVDIRDSLIPNTTYTIDFSDAIRDLNEGNVLDGFAIDFSTGDSIDSLRISGMVFEARTLRTGPGDARRCLQQSIRHRSPYTSHGAHRTNQSARPVYNTRIASRRIPNFCHQRCETATTIGTVRGYRILRHYNKSWAETVVITDTLTTAEGVDSIVTREARDYFPNDILLTWFNEGYQSQYLKDYRRPERKKLTVDFGTRSDSLPELTILNGPLTGASSSQWARLNAVATLRYSRVFHHRFGCLWYGFNACGNEISAHRHCLRALYGAPIHCGSASKTPKRARGQLKKEAKERERKIERILKEREEAGDTSKTILPSDTIEIKFLQFSSKSGGTQELACPMWFTTDQPLLVDTIPESIVTFAMMRDTVWDTIPAPRIYRPDSLRLLSFKADYAWAPATKYKLSIDSAGLHGVYGLWNSRTDFEFTTKSA